ncbi:MAG: hypothetical protein KJO82_16095 [Gammaproteobacteria bacterium]|nr:hypothetical protein [Gammaproteobacteria bacterium]
MKPTSLASLVLLLSACGGGSGGGTASVPDSTAIPNDSPGGYWVGTDGDNLPVVALADEDGLFYFLEGRFENSSGLLSVSNGDSIRGAFSLTQSPGVPDPTEGSDCKLDGSVSERNSMTLDASCKALNGQQLLTTLTFDYDPRYERESSLAIIAGNYDYAVGGVLNIAEDGTVFSQDDVTGCITNGRVLLNNPDYNVYNIAMQYTGCSRLDPAVHREQMFGMATLDNSVSPERLLIIVTARIDDSTVAVASTADRL